MTARPALPLPPVTTTLFIGSSLRPRSVVPQCRPLRKQVDGRASLTLGKGGEGAPGHQTRQINKLGRPQPPGSAGVSDAAPWPPINVTYQWRDPSSPTYTHDGSFMAVRFRYAFPS